MSSTGNSHVWRQPRPVPLFTIAVGVSIALVLTVAFVAVSADVSPWIGMGAIGGVIVCLGMFLSPIVSLAAVALSLPLERLGRLTEDFSSFTISLSRFVGLLALIALLLYAF